MESYWINQPSRLQPYHKYHRQEVLVNKKDIKNNSSCRCYFNKGNIISMIIKTDVLNLGWLSDINNCLGN